MAIDPICQNKCVQVSAFGGQEASDWCLAGCPQVPDPAPAPTFTLQAASLSKIQSALANRPTISSQATKTYSPPAAQSASGPSTTTYLIIGGVILAGLGWYLLKK